MPDYKGNGAEEGTRTPTPLRAHGPEPCASANSATSANLRLCAAAQPGHLSGKDYELYSTEAPLTVKPARPQRSRLPLLKIVALQCLCTDASAYGMSYPEDVAPGPEN